MIIGSSLSKILRLGIDKPTPRPNARIARCPVPRLRSWNMVPIPSHQSPHPFFPNTAVSHLQFLNRNATQMFVRPCSTMVTTTTIIAQLHSFHKLPRSCVIRPTKKIYHRSCFGTYVPMLSFLPSGSKGRLAR
jgi:hypothetical protein